MKKSKVEEIKNDDFVEFANGVVGEPTDTEEKCEKDIPTVVDTYTKNKTTSNVCSNPQPPARAGYVHPCEFCGEDAGTGKFCKTCRTADGRREVFEENKKVLVQLREKGYCLTPVNLKSA